MNKKIFLYAILGACFLSFGVITPVLGATSSETFTEGFESYTTGNDLYTESDFWYLDSGLNEFDISETRARSGIKSAETTADSASGNYMLRSQPLSGLFQINLSFYWESSNADCDNIDFYFRNSETSEYFIIQPYGGECVMRILADNTEVSVSADQWNDLAFQIDTSAGEARVSSDGGSSWSSWESITSTQYTGDGIDKLYLYVSSDGIFIDDISEEEVYQAPSFTIYPPESGATITDMETGDFDISWLNWATSTYYDFCIFWEEYETEITVGRKCLIRTSETGSEEDIAYSDFGFDKNGKFRATVRARKINESGRPYIASDNLMFDDDYHIFVNVSGWDEYFSMPDYGDWYSTTVDRFATPTAFFSGVAGFLDPFFSKIGEFGNRVEEYFDSEEAYNTGYELGIGIPLMRQYVDLIDVFFGGFPVIEVFLIILVLMLAIFIVRLILKLVPTLG